MMKKTFSETKLDEISKILDARKSFLRNSDAAVRSPVHVVYGGANLFKFDAPQKLGALALKSIETFAPNFVEFARAMWLRGADALPSFAEQIADLENQSIENLENQSIENAEKLKHENFDVWFARTIYRKTIEKLRTEPIEDFRIDFEDGYGFRPDHEEDAHAISASDELAKAFLQKTITTFCGFRPKSFQPETFKRSVRTLDLFLTNLIEKCAGVLPENFVVTLPKISCSEEVAVLDELLGEFEKRNDLKNGAIEIEIMIETPEAILGENGEIVLRKLVEAGGGRVNSAHFGAFDYTARFGIAGAHQHLGHEACVFARQMMQISLAPMNIRLSDSVTTEMPVAVHKGERLSPKQTRENKNAVERAWRAHFNNVTHSLINGFYQSWDLHPAQLPARYAAVYQFFLENAESQATRLKGFVGKATQASLTGNTFDDAASAQGLLNFFARALNCGALSEKEITETTNLTSEELRASSFVKIMETRRKTIVY